MLTLLGGAGTRSVRTLIELNRARHQGPLWLDGLSRMYSLARPAGRRRPPQETARWTRRYPVPAKRSRIWSAVNDAMAERRGVHGLTALGKQAAFEVGECLVLQKVLVAWALGHYPGSAA